MNASAKWLRRALLGGVALGAMATGAQADELSALKAQLEALQSRVNQLETTGPATSAAYPEGASFISFRRGSDLYKVDGPYNRAGEEDSGDRGFTIAITPTADLPAPIMEVSVSGYVKGDLIYDTHNNLGLSASPGNVAIGGGDDENFQAHARQSRFRIKSKSDTAVGQIRTLIEGDFEANISSGGFRLRHAWGEWDMTPNLTLGVGQTWSTHYHFVGEIPTVDFSGLLGTSGFNSSRNAQIQLKSSSGPVSWAIGLQNPRSEVPGGDDNQLPDLAAKANFDLGGASIGVSGIIREIHLDGSANGTGPINDSEVGWGVSAGIDLPLGDMFSLHATGGYGDGDSSVTGSPTGAAAVVGGSIRSVEAYGFAAGATLKLSEASSINAAYSYAAREKKNLGGAQDRAWEKIHVNYLWQPVSKLRMGVEGIYAERTIAGGADDDNLRFQFGTWFFF
jgi:opacity protein-like surface antigen